MDDDCASSSQGWKLTMQPPFIISLKVPASRVINRSHGQTNQWVLSAVSTSVAAQTVDSNRHSHQHTKPVTRSDKTHERLTWTLFNQTTQDKMHISEDSPLFEATNITKRLTGTRFNQTIQDKNAYFQEKSSFSSHKHYKTHKGSSVLCNKTEERQQTM